MNWLAGLLACSEAQPAIDRSDCTAPERRDQDGPFSRSEFGLGWAHAAGWRTANPELQFGSRGVVVGDWDGDGHLDLIAPQDVEPTRALLGDGRGGFSEAPGLLDDAPALVGPIGGATADWDADGDLDVFLFGQLSPATLLNNDGTGHFTTEPHPEWDVVQPGCGGTAAFGDADADGDLDLFYGRMGRGLYDVPMPCTSRLLLNNGSELIDHSERLDPSLQLIRSTAGGFYQLDGDPEPELYAVALEEGVYTGGNVALDLQPDGTWTPLAATGLDLHVAGMGVAAADVNGDGRTDFAIAGFGEVPYLVSTGEQGLWADAAQSQGLVPDADADQVVAWGGEFADFDLDGRLDLAMAFGTALQSPRAQPDAIWQGTDTGFVPIAEAWGVADPEVMRGFVVADVNEDGWPDLLKREHGGVVVLQASRCGTAAWLEVRLHAPGTNPDAIGARVRVVAGAQHWDRTLSAGSTSFASGGPPTTWFGLGDLAAVDAVEVTWPDGQVTDFGPTDTRRVLRLVRP